MVRMRSQSGFTLVEMMVVVAIVGIMAVLAVTTYGRYTRKAASSEAAAMLGEIRAKEEAYLAENGKYISTTQASSGADETDIHPLLSPSGYVVRAWNPSTTTTNWAQLGVNPPRRQLYCGYVAIAGAAGTKPGSSTAGAVILSTPSSGGTANIKTPWFYARGCCDFEPPGSSSVTGACPADGANLTVFSISYYDNVLREAKPGN